MKWILIAAMAEMVGTNISPNNQGYFMQGRYLPAADMHSPTMIAQYETREECEKYASTCFSGNLSFLRG